MVSCEVTIPVPLASAQPNPRSRVVHAGTRLPSGMDAAPGSPGGRSSTPAPSPPSAGASASPQAPATAARSGASSTRTISAAAPADTSS
jgi:hypothetical protein